MRKMAVYLGRSAAICFAAIAVLALPSPSIAAAAAGGKVVPTHVTAPTVTRAADGTITITDSFTSPNRRCLPAKRFTPVLATTPVNTPRFHSPFWTLLYYGTGVPSLSNAEPVGGVAIPFTPISPQRHSPYVWQAVYPGTEPVTGWRNIVNPGSYQVPGTAPDGSGVHTFTSSVAAARVVTVAGVAPPTGYTKAKDPFYHVSYRSGGTRRSLLCRVAQTPFQAQFPWAALLY